MSSSYPSSSSFTPTLVAIMAFMCTSSIVLMGVVFIGLIEVNFALLSFSLAILCCVLLAKNVHYLAKSRAGAVEGGGARYTLLGASQSLYTQLYQKSPVPYFVIDAEGVIMSANVAGARLLGLQQQKVVGRNIFTLIRTESATHQDILVEKYRGEIGISDELVSIMRPDHKEVWALFSLFTFKTPEAKQQGLLTLVDITRQKKAENAKTEFVSLASHQLRTPIAGMKWSAELLQMDNPETLTDRQVKYLNRLVASISRMSVLVDDFLRVSRFELGNFKPQYQVVSLATLLGDIMTDINDTARHKNITVHTNFDPQVTNYLTDPNLLRMTVANLYSNAVKYTPVGGSVTVTCERRDHILYISITDTGMGITETEHDQIFSKLFRASNAVKNEPDGTGLGLYIVREAVSVLRGQVSFVSDEGRGTTFEVQLPYQTGSET